MFRYNGGCKIWKIWNMYMLVTGGPKKMRLKKKKTSPRDDVQFTVKIPRATKNTTIKEHDSGASRGSLSLKWQFGS